MRVDDLSARGEIVKPSHIVANKLKACEHRDSVVAMSFTMAESVEDWGHYGLGNALRAMALDFDAGDEAKTALKRRFPGCVREALTTTWTKSTRNARTTLPPNTVPKVIIHVTQHAFLTPNDLVKH